MQIEINVNRDSVHPGDDIVSHSKQIRISSSSTVKELVEMIRQSDYLPKIVGGNATWIVDCLGAYYGVIAVDAQQWKAPKLAVQEGTLVSKLLVDGKANLYFRYWCQSDPEMVYESVIEGNDLPSKY
ncbi:peptidoglycan/xylan/chitin deacetylase (PgdA/CDA1 family) [Oxalobacteraceae bacterium GrIS 2.11]